MYDIFLVAAGEINNDTWLSFKEKFPNAQKLENVKTFEEVKTRAFTKMFWVVWDHLNITDFEFDYRVPKWDEEYVHVFKNKDYFFLNSLYKSLVELYIIFVLCFLIF
jgi:hypothetical protein